MTDIAPARLALAKFIFDASLDLLAQGRVTFPLTVTVCSEADPDEIIFQVVCPQTGRPFEFGPLCPWGETELALDYPLVIRFESSDDSWVEATVSKRKPS